jgi:hypothetical protein
MDEAAKVLEFLSAFQHLAWDPEIYGQSSETLDNRFKSLVQSELSSKATNSKGGHKIQTSVTFAIFGSSSNNLDSVKGIETTSNKLKVCQLQQDEMLLGWRSRMCMINCLPDDRSIDRLIAQMAGQQKPNLEGLDFVENVSAILGISKEVLLQKHSLSTFFNALEGLRQSKIANKSIKHRQAYQRYAPYRIGSKTLKYCSACAANDFSKLGYSYWRCSHQMPGVLWCSEHDNLLSTHNDVANFKGPHQISAPNMDSRIGSFSRDQIKILKRYAQIAYEILNQASTIDSGAASVALGKQAKAKNFRISKPGVKITPSTMLIKVLPKWWLEETFPRVHWISDKYIWTIDGACSPGASRYTSPTLCLLAAMFYENAEEAISEILKPREIIEERGFEFWASKKIYYEYIAHQGVVSRVAEKLSLPHSTVGLGLLNQGLPGLGKSTATAHAALEFLNGKPLHEASSAFQTSVEDIESLIRAGCAKFKFALNEICNKSTSTPPLIKYVEKKQASG